jgi:lysophospholipase L1-like esterase
MAVMRFPIFAAVFVLLATFSAAEPAVAPKPHNFAKWEKDIAAFEKRDAENAPPKHSLLFIGSSGIVRWKSLATDFPGVTILNRAFGGNEIADSTHFAERMIFPYEPKMIFLRAGGNDIHAGKSAEQVFEDYKTFVATTQAALAALKSAGHTCELRGMIWQQGENDAAGPAAAAYQANLTNLITRVRKDLFENKPLPFVIGGLSDSQNPDIKTPGTGWNLVRKAQETVAQTLPKTGFVNTDGFSTRTGEAIHFSHEGQIALGKAHAAEMLRLEKP